MSWRNNLVFASQSPKHNRARICRYSNEKFEANCFVWTRNLFEKPLFLSYCKLAKKLWPSSVMARCLDVNSQLLLRASLIVIKSQTRILNDMMVLFDLQVEFELLSFAIKFHASAIVLETIGFVKSITNL